MSIGTLFQSLGLKRLIASLLSAVVEVLRVIPGNDKYVLIIEQIAGFFGITGLIHAGVDKNLTRKKLATASAALSGLIVLTYAFPQLEPLRPALEKLAAILGAAAIGSHLKTKELSK